MAVWKAALMVAPTVDDLDETMVELKVENWVALKAVQKAVVTAALMVVTTADEWDETMAGSKVWRWAAS